MTSTAIPLPGVEDVRDLDATGVLDAVVARRRTADRAEADLVALVVHWVDVHPVLDDTTTASWRSDTPCLGVDAHGQVAEPPVAGAGTPPVAEGAVEELAAALNLPYAAGLRLVSESLELCYRLPRLWARVQTGRLPAWQARQVAARTTTLSRAAVDFVDRHTATTTNGRGRVRLAGLNALIHEARLQCDPDQAAGIEQAALDARGVWFDHRASTATTDLTARLDTLDALDLDDTISDSPP